jgi:hypothetical protein
MTDYSRPLDTDLLVRNFLQNVLQYNFDPNGQHVYKIVEGELGIAHTSQFKSLNTYDSNSFRHHEYLEDDARWKLRAQIVEELFTMPKLDHDDNIALGSGGACPVNGIQAIKRAYVVIGLPASGKSGIADLISEQVGGIVIDSDYAKRKLPEYRSHKYGASIVHKESGKIVSGFDDKPEKYEDVVSLSEKAILNGYNIVLPKIGHSLKDLLLLSESYKKLGYEIHLTLVNLDRRKSAIRAVERYLGSDRYVPIGLIFDGYGNDPILNYYTLKSHFAGAFHSFGIVTTDVKRGEQPKCIECINNNPSNLFQTISYPITL